MLRAGPRRRPPVGGDWPAAAPWAKMRPGMTNCLQEVIDHVRHTPRVWVATLGEIAAHWRTRA